MNNLPDEPVLATDAELTQTLQRYGITVPVADLPRIAAARDFMRGLADMLAEMPEVHTTGPATTFGSG